MEHPKQQIETIFAAAIEVDDPASRQQLVERACGGDAKLRQRVDELLANHAGAGSFLDSPAPPVRDLLAGARDGTMSQHQSEPLSAMQAGTVIGRYRLLERIGEGGMGIVFMAQQQEPVRRKVALKVIKTGMDTGQVVARFSAERQALALMDHPNIARVLDGGSTDQGRPYFVMELVQGVPITEYCDTNQLSARQRLELFIPVCQAVQHAHQKGVIHRDLKPSNVLITLADGVPVPKVIDFGVAKAVGQDLTDQTLFTQFAQMVGTPLYMSPEQAAGGADVDTRSDVYSLGVLLYELLTGTTPFDRQRLGKAAYDEIRRIIREEEPPKPSTRISALEGAALVTVSAQRKVDSRRLGQIVRGELDWIVMKAIEKDRGRRYESASGLARDVERYLTDEAVQACPPSAMYRMRKFARRNKRPMFAAGLVTLALVAGMVGTSWGLVRARDARDAAGQRAEGERVAKEVAQKRLGQIEKINEILQSIFADLDPDAVSPQGKPLRILLGERLDRATQALEGEAVGDPLTVARLQLTLAGTQLGLGNADKAMILATRARATFSALRGPDDPGTLLAMLHQAGAHRLDKDLDRAVPLYEEVLRRRTATRGAGHADTRVARDKLADAYFDASRFDDGMALMQEELNLAKAEVRNGVRPDLVDVPTASKIAKALVAIRQYDDAINIYKECLERQIDAHGPEDPTAIQIMDDLATAYFSAGNLTKTIPLVEQVFRLQRARLGPDDHRTLHAMYTLAALYQRARMNDKALPLLEQKLASNQRLRGPDHHVTIEAMEELGTMFWHLGRHDRAIEIFLRALPLREAKSGKDDPETIATMANLGINYRDAGQPEKGLPLLAQAVERQRKRSGEAATLSWFIKDLAECYEQAGDFAKAEPLRSESLDRARQLPVQGKYAFPPHAAMALLGSNLLQQKKYADAEPVLRECLTFREKNELDAWTTFVAKSLLGAALAGQQKYVDAEPLLLDGYRGLKQREAKIPTIVRDLRLTKALERIVSLYELQGDTANAAEWRNELDARKKSAGESGGKNGK